MVISMPACASVMRKSAAISDKRPMGMNSDVLKIKAETVMPINGSHSRVVILFSIYIKHLTFIL